MIVDVPFDEMADMHPGESLRQRKLIDGNTFSVKGKAEATQDFDVNIYELILANQPLWRLEARESGYIIEEAVAIFLEDLIDGWFDDVPTEEFGFNLDRLYVQSDFQLGSVDLDGLAEELAADGLWELNLDQ